MSAQRAAPFSLANYEPACEYRSDLSDLVAMHTELLLHARNVCIVYIRTVEVVAKVSQTAKGQDEPVQLEYQLPFSFARGVIAPQGYIGLADGTHRRLFQVLQLR